MTDEPPDKKGIDSRIASYLARIRAEGERYQPGAVSSLHNFLLRGKQEVEKPSNHPGLER